MQENINIPDSEITTNLSFRQLVLMNMQQLTNFPYIEKDFDALTDYELLCLVVKFLNDVIANQNEQNASITRMYQSFLALQDYVNNTKDELETAFNNLDNYVRNYFDNLDVQEEINNKLDQMLEDGVLEQIIEQFIQSSALWCFDTVSDMKLATNLINGSYAKTLGYSNINDGGSSLYKIRTKTNEDVIDEKTIIALSDSTIVAELINNKINNIKVFNDDIITAIKNSEVLYLNNTTYNVTVNETIAKTNIHIIGNGAIINSTSNVTYIFNLLNAIIENVNFTETNISDNTKNILFTGKNIEFKNCEFLSSVGYSGEIENIKFTNCTFNNYYRDIHQGSGKLQNLEVINCKFIRNQNYSEPYQGDTKILIYNYNGGTSPLDENMLSIHGNNITIKNCEFAPCNKRQIHVFNCENVEISFNKFNSNKTDSTSIGGSDDLVSIDFVNYFKINNNYFDESGENELDLLSSHYGEVLNNVLLKSYDQYEIDINWSDYIRTFGENLTNRELIKSSDIMIKNNTINSNQFTFFITPSNNIHLHENNIINNVSPTIILFSDFGSLDSSNPSNLKVSNVDIGNNNVKTSLGNFGRVSVRTGYNYVIDENSGHLSKDICCYETQEVSANSQVFCTPNFPCVNGEAGKLIALDGSFRSVTPSLVRWQNSQSTRRGIDFIGNRYNSPYWGTLFYTGDFLDKYPLGQAGDANASYDGTETSGVIAFKSW